MMDGQQQTAGTLRTGIEPHRLHHRAGRRCKPPLGRLRLLRNDARKPASERPPTSIRRRHAAAGPAGRKNLKLPVRAFLVPATRSRNPS